MGLTLDDEIGHGTYGKVFRGKNSKGQVVAVKCYRTDGNDCGIDVGIMREIVYLKSLPPHINIIRLDEIEWVGNRLRISMPLFQMDLRKHMKRRRREQNLTHPPDHIDSTHKISPLTRDEILCYSRQILLGLDHLHRHGVAARDVKPANILINFDFPEGHEGTEPHLVLCDFSLASNLCTKLDHSTTIQTLWYRAIEILLGSARYGTGVDMWSFGCVLAFLCTGTDLIVSDCNYGQIIEIFKITGTPVEKIPLNSSDTDVRQYPLWPNITSMPYYSPQMFPKFRRNMNQKIFGDGTTESSNHSQFEPLFWASLTIDPTNRCTARQALEMLENV